MLSDVYAGYNFDLIYPDLKQREVIAFCAKLLTIIQLRNDPRHSLSAERFAFLFFANSNFKLRAPSIPPIEGSFDLVVKSQFPQRTSYLFDPFELTNRPRGCFHVKSTGQATRDWSYLRVDVHETNA